MSDDLGVTFDIVSKSYEGVIPTGKTEWVQGKIGEAVRELKSHLPDIEQRIADGKVDPKLVIDKVVAAVLRVVRNPTGIVQENEGDYGYKIDKLVASGDIWYPNKDLAALGWVNEDKSRMARTVFSRPSRGFGFPG